MYCNLNTGMIFQHTKSPYTCIFSREHRPCGVSERWPNQRGICHGERHKEEGEAIPGNPLCPPPCGAPPLGCSSGYRGLGGGERWHAPASYVRLGDLWITKGRRTWQDLSSFLVDDTPLLLLRLSLSLFPLQVYPGSRNGCECFSDHVNAIHSTRAFRGLSVSKRLHSSRGNKRGQTTGGLRYSVHILPWTK